MLFAPWLYVILLNDFMLFCNMAFFEMSDVRSLSFIISNEDAKIPQMVLKIWQSLFVFLSAGLNDRYGTVFMQLWVIGNMGTLNVQSLQNKLNQWKLILSTNYNDLIKASYFSSGQVVWVHPSCTNLLLHRTSISLMQVE